MAPSTNETLQERTSVASELGAPLRRPLGIVGGSAFLDSVSLVEDGHPPSLPELRRIPTPRGPVLVHDREGVVFLRRHGEESYLPPHRIPHHAHVLAMVSAGVEQVAGLTSTGSLDPEIRPGDVVVPEDYLSRHPPPTFAGDEYLHIVPELDPRTRSLLLRAAHEAVALDGGRVIDGGVYGETRGPRFETRAEVRALARDASIVGMTAASEATLFQERNVGYACLCIVDNWAHGLGTAPLSLEAFRERQAENAAVASRILQALIRIWRREMEST